MQSTMTRQLKTISKLVLAFGAILVLCLSSLPRVSAQSPGASGLSVSPTRNEITLKPSEEQSFTITLKNITSGPVTATPEVNDFEADNATGNPKIIKSNTPLSTSIKPFITDLDSVPLNVNEQKNVIISAKAPKDASPGAYYGLISYKSVPAGSQAPAPGSVALSATVSTIVLITVPGNITDSVQLKSVNVYADNKSKTGGTLFTKPPQQAGVEIRNLGNGFAKPFGKVVVKNMLGKEVYTYEINNTDPRANVLPKSTRTFRNDIKNVSRPGRYTVTANVSFGSGSTILVSSKSFWYMPWWLIAVVLALIVLLAVLTYLALRRWRGRRYHHGR